MRPAVVAALVAGLARVGCAASAERASGDDAAQREGAEMGTFRCEDAAAAFGHAGAAVESCQELLPGFWRVVLAGPGLPHGADVLRGAWIGPERVAAEGLPAFARWARAVDLYAAPRLEPWAVGQVLEALAAFPDGFDAESVASVVDPETGEPGLVRRDPLTVVAYRVGYAPPGGEPGPDLEPTVGRATLRGTPDYAFAWTVELREPGGVWTPVTAGR